MILVKEVTIIRIDGASDISVSMTNIWILLTTSCPSSAELTERSTEKGIGVSVSVACTSIEKNATVVKTITAKNAT